MTLYRVDLDERVPSPVRTTAERVVADLAELFAIPRPEVRWIELASTGQWIEGRRYVELTLREDGRGSVRKSEPHILYLRWEPYRGGLEVILTAAHEIGHIVEILGCLPPLVDREWWPRHLADVVVARVGDGIGEAWTERLVERDPLVRAVAAGDLDEGQHDWAASPFWTVGGTRAAVTITQLYERAGLMTTEPWTAEAGLMQVDAS